VLRIRPFLAPLPIALAVALVAARAISEVVAKVGHAGAPLDDAYIHFQYARAIAEGHPMRFQAGEPISTGATSLLWPAILAPFWALGARGDAIVWPAWLLSFSALGGLAWEAIRLTDRLAGRAAAIGAGAMVVAFGGFVWCAASGMEVVPFAWIIARASRRASEWAEAPPADRGRGRRLELIGLAWASALMRPEGAVTSLFVAATLAAFTRRAQWHERASALAALAGAIASPALLLVLTGSLRSNTAIAKLLPGHPYYVGSALASAVAANARTLLGTLLNGDVWSAEFLPSGGAAAALTGLSALVWLGTRKRNKGKALGWRTFGVLLLALTMLAPCFYVTFLWNRLRYLWPFATGWLVGLACLARVVGDLAGAIRPRWRIATPLVCGVFVGLFASKLGWVLDDVAQSASGIHRQQVALGQWAKDNLPTDARIGVNDTGAIAYFSDKKTFDVVGLTTQGEARYWVSGVGSRLEHYERLYAKSPEKLPTHFIVYPEWMALDSVLGQPLHEATVTDATILGGQTMRAYTADWSALGSGEQPWSPEHGVLIDSFDVADLESEAAHNYDLLGAHDGATQGIVRVDAPHATTVRVLANGEPIGSFEVGLDEDRVVDETWVERSFEIPQALADERTHIELRAEDGWITTYHYWFVI
jgi:hypothetical protein